MTHSATKHYTDRDDDGRAAGGPPADLEVTEEYLCTDKELGDAGFQLRDIDDMPEHESEFASDPWGGDAPQDRNGAGLGELVELLDIDPRPPRAA